MENETALVILTGALVLITGYYAWQNRQMVEEMRNARELSVTPKLALTMHLIGPTYPVTRLMNIGQGPAIDVETTLRFIRRQGDPLEIQWQATFMAPGEIHDFLEPPDLRHIESSEQLVDECSEITLTGSMNSSLGTGIEVRETTGDLRDWYEMSSKSQHVWEDEPRRKIPTELEKLRKMVPDELKKLRQAVEGVRQEMSQRREEG